MLRRGAPHLLLCLAVLNMLRRSRRS